MDASGVAKECGEGLPALERIASDVQHQVRERLARRLVFSVTLPFPLRPLKRPQACDFLSLACFGALRSALPQAFPDIALGIQAI